MTPHLSVVVPLYNEEGNVAELWKRISTALSSYSYEVIAVDDGSRDDTFDVLSTLAKTHPNLRVIRFSTNAGQTAALAAGITEARGDIIVTIDGDLENDPHDIPALLAKLDEEFDVVKWVNEILPEGKPRHLLGIGEPEDLFMGVENGVDLFDCVLPTRLGRNGTLYTKYGKINILNAKYKNQFESVDFECECYSCKNYTKAYLNHLFKGKEMLAGTLATVHNLYFIVNLVKRIRQSILEENFFEYKNEFLSLYNK